MATTPSTVWSDAELEEIVPYGWYYYWHPESDSLMRCTSPMDDPELDQLTEREYILLTLFMLDEEAFDLVVETTEEPEEGLV